MYYNYKRGCDKLKTRIISAIVALIIFVPLIILGGWFIKIGVAVLAILGMKEFLDLPNKGKRPIYVDIIFYALVLILTLMNERRTMYYLLTFLIPSLIVIFCNDNKKYNADDSFKLSGMCLLIGVVFHEFILIRESNIMLLIYLFLITISTDTFAQFGGMLIGKHKLAPKISPKKTWEGSITGGIFGTLIPTVFYYLTINSNANIFGLVLITFLLSCLGQLGDLFFSCIKRNHDIKDFSNIMPGHGGVLDRLDSIIFAIIGYILLSGII